jgi:hypothetical protein
MVDGALDGGANHSSSGRSNTKAFEETLARYRELSARALLELIRAEARRICTTWS